LFFESSTPFSTTNQLVIMDAPEPEQTPFNAVQAQTSKLARVSPLFDS
jgi:hypothetical protein